MFALSKASCALRNVLRMPRSLYSTTSVLMEKFNIVVPPMGESVKSGSGLPLTITLRNSRSVGKECWRFRQSG